MKNSICEIVFSSLDLRILTSDIIDILQHFIPTESEIKAFTSYLADGKSIMNLSDEDRFLYGVKKIRFFLFFEFVVFPLALENRTISTEIKCRFIHGEFQ